MDLRGAIALVTGGTKRIGKAISIALARAGCDLALHYGRSAREAGEVAVEIRALGRRAEGFQADLARPEQIEAMLAAVGRAFGRLDVLVNNASVHHRTPIQTLTPEQWDEEFAVNARAAALCIRHALDLMPNGGAIVNIADISADSPRAGHPAYCASKAALIALTKSCAKSLAARNIRVNAVSPGVAAWPEDASQREKDAVLRQVPMKRPGCPEDIAAAVVFLLRNDYVTGQNIRVDGGWCMG